MSTIGNLTTSYLSARNENTLALLNLNLDFSLVKCKAPKEFAVVGESLSARRRKNAKDGPTHKTARRLGALFEQLVLSTPRLLKAYSLRATKIIQTLGINPQGTEDDGLFKSFVGTDCNSIWAA